MIWEGARDRCPWLNLMLGVCGGRTSGLKVRRAASRKKGNEFAVGNWTGGEESRHVCRMREGLRFLSNLGASEGAEAARSRGTIFSMKAEGDNESFVVRKRNSRGVTAVKRPDALYERPRL